jgi:transcriptional regulator with XRE-family HTH domain
MQPDYLKQIGGHIRAKRVEARLTQEDLAERTGVNSAYLGRIERGEINVTIHTLSAIAEGLRVSLFDLIRSPRPEPDAAQLRKEARRLLYELDGPTLAIVKELLDQSRQRHRK